MNTLAVWYLTSTYVHVWPVPAYLDMSSVYLAVLNNNRRRCFLVVSCCDGFLKYRTTQWQINTCSPKRHISNILRRICRKEVLVFPRQDTLHRIYLSCPLYYLPPSVCNRASCLIFQNEHFRTAAGALVQWLKLSAWKIGDRGFKPHPGLQVSKKHYVSFSLN